MTRYWTSYWRGAFWFRNKSNRPIETSGGGRFEVRGIKPGDFVYIVSIQRGQLRLGGRMQIKQIVSRETAVTLLKARHLYESDEWLIGRAGSGTPLKLNRILAAEVVRDLRFLSGGGERKLAFKDLNALDGQTLRAVRELSARSADLLDQVISLTDANDDTVEIVVPKSLLTEKTR